MNESITDLILKKPIHSLQLEDIINYFSKEQRETNLIEFKYYKDFATFGSTKTSRDKEKLNTVIETICAFLNSDGGVLIWGAPEGVVDEGSNEKVFRGNLTPVTFTIEPEQLISKIISQISPVPNKILFQPIKIKEDSFCYVFEIKKSDYPPHQFKGAYYMRLDGSTHAAPHHYVEALIKKISYPRLEGHLSFGNIREYSKLASIPMQLTIHNLSKFINEKNLRYRILARGCDIINPFQNLQEINFNYEADIRKDAMDILHCNMPYECGFLIITQRLMPRAYPISIDIVLLFWGELSPVLNSMYKIEVFGDRQTVRTRYSITESNENVYLYESSEATGVNESDRLKKSRESLFQMFQSKVDQLSIHEQLHKL